MYDKVRQAGSGFFYYQANKDHRRGVHASPKPTTKGIKHDRTREAFGKFPKSFWTFPEGIGNLPGSFWRLTEES
jgi:hypothetical protein